MEAVPAPLVRAGRQNPVLRKLIRPLVNRVVPRHATPVTVKSGPAKGIRLVILPREEKFLWSGLHEPGFQRTLCERLGPGAVFWDVGAHCGFFTCLASRIVGDEGRVVAFEPSSENRKRLLGSVALNHGANVDVQPFAVSARSGEVAMQRHSTSTTWHLIQQTAPDEEAALHEAEVKVSCRTLDELAKEFPLPDLIKIDVEGAEVDVLRGGRRLLHGHRPVLLVEVHSQEGPENAEALLDGYAFECVGDRRWLLTPVP
jgi:FkbM family methyltransferase